MSDPAKHQRASLGERIARVADDVFSDVVSSARGLRRSLRMTALIVGIIAVGAGANGAVFGILDQLFWHAPTGVKNPDSVHRLTIQQKQRGGALTIVDAVGAPDIADLRAAASPDASLEGYQLRVGVHRIDGHVPINVAFITPGYFDLLGVGAQLGRLFPSTDDSSIDLKRAVVVSEAFWRSHLGADQKAIGRQLAIDSVSFVIVGVVGDEFQGLDLNPVDAWMPVVSMSSFARLGTGPNAPLEELKWLSWHHYPILIPIVRSRNGFSTRILEARLSEVYRRDDPLASGGSIHSTIKTAPLIELRGSHRVSPLSDREIRFTTSIAVIAAISLIGCIASAAGLLLLKALHRRREIGVKLALGISRRRLIRQFAVDGLLLGVGSALVALVIARWGSFALRATLLSGIRWTSFPTEHRAMVITLVLAICAGFVASLGPALLAADTRLSEVIGSSFIAGQRARSTSSLIVLQIGVSTALLAASGTFVRSSYRALTLDLGFDADRLAILSMPDVSPGIASETLAQLREMAKSVPGVENVAIAGGDPMDGARGTFILRLSTGDTVPMALRLRTIFNIVDANFFAASGLRVVRGRGIGSGDDARSEPVAIVSQSMARKLWGEADPLKGCFYLFVDKGPCVRVVGIAEDTRNTIVGPPPLRFYLSLKQSPIRYYMPSGTPDFMGRILVIRTAGAPTATQLRAFKEMSGSVALPAQSRIEMTLPRDRLAPEVRPLLVGAVLLSGAGILTLVLVGVGLFGAIAFEMRARHHEMGVRIALGAEPQDIAKLVFTSGFRVAVPGAVLGLAMTIASARLVNAMLFNTSTNDPLVLTIVMAALATTTIVASLLPALDAARIDVATAARF